MCASSRLARRCPRPWRASPGRGSGQWSNSDLTALCHTLVVEEVFANGFARVIFSHGASAGWDIPLPGFWRVTGRIVDGDLRFHLPVPERPELAYRLAGETL